MRLRENPILAGGILAPTLDNSPLLRLYPQPDKVSGMIRNRKRARLLRLEKPTQAPTNPKRISNERSSLLHSQQPGSTRSSTKLGEGSESDAV
jgi:hypothetical protein